MKTPLFLIVALLLPLTPTAMAGPGNKKAPKEPTNGHSALYDWLIAFDVNKDGKLDAQERAAVQEAFDKKDFMASKLDTNANGRLESDEIDRVIKEQPGKKTGNIRKATPKTK